MSLQEIQISGAEEPAVVCEIATVLRTRDDFLILGHLRPDGDATGSVSGLSLPGYCLKFAGLPQKETVQRFAVAITHPKGERTWPDNRLPYGDGMHCCVWPHWPQPSEGPCSTPTPRT